MTPYHDLFKSAIHVFTDFALSWASRNTAITVSMEVPEALGLKLTFAFFFIQPPKEVCCITQSSVGVVGLVGYFLCPLLEALCYVSK